MSDLQRRGQAGNSGANLILVERPEAKHEAARVGPIQNEAVQTEGFDAGCCSGALSLSGVHAVAQETGGIQASLNLGNIEGASQTATPFMKETCKPSRVEVPHSPHVTRHVTFDHELAENCLIESDRAEI